MVIRHFYRQHCLSERGMHDLLQHGEGLNMNLLLVPRSLWEFMQYRWCVTNYIPTLILRLSSNVQNGCVSKRLILVDEVPCYISILLIGNANIRIVQMSTHSKKISTGFCS